jgi:phage I-like protein
MTRSASALEDKPGIEGMNELVKGRIVRYDIEEYRVLKPKEETDPEPMEEETRPLFTLPHDLLARLLLHLSPRDIFSFGQVHPLI